MQLLTKKSLLALSISMLMSTTLLTACSSSKSSNNSNNNNTQQTEQKDEQKDEKKGLDVKAYAKDAKFEPVEVVHWNPTPVLPSEPDKFDEQVISMNIQNGDVVAITRWHNSIIKFSDKQDKDSLIKPAKFATLLTAEHGVKSSDDDIISGASEHLLSEVKYTPDNKVMYALVNQPKRGTTDDDDTYGLFKVTLENGAIPSQTIRGMPVAHRGSHVQRVADAKITDILLLDNGALLAMDETNHAIRYYDKDFKLQESMSIALAEGEELVNWTADKQAIYVLTESENGDKTQQSIHKYMLDAPSKVVKTHNVAANIEIQTIKSNGQQLITISDKDVQLYDTNFELQSKIVISAGIDEASISTDFKRVAVLDENEALSLIDINGKTLSAPIVVNLDNVKSFGDFTLADANSLFFNSDRGMISKLNLNQPMVTLTDKQAIESSLANMQEELINHGYPISAVRYDLNLPTKDINLPISYSWSSSNSAVISNTGKVNQPTNGAPIDVSLTVTAKTADGKATAQRTFNLTVLPTSAVIDTGVQSNLNELFPKDKRRNRSPRFNYNGQYSNNTANADGSLYGLFINDGLTILQKQPDNSVKAVMAGAQKLIVPQAEGLNMSEPEVISLMWQSNDAQHSDTLWVLLGDKTSGALLKKTLTNTNDFNKLSEQANNNEWTIVKKYQHPVVAGFINNNKTHISIVQDKGNKDETNNGYQVTTYAVATNQDVADYSIDRNLSRDYVTVDDTGRYIFVTTRNKATGGGTFYRYVDGKLDSQFDVDEPYHSGVVTDDGNFIASGRYGHLLFVKNAKGNTPIVLTASKKYSFARENYDGKNYLLEKDHHNGRIYSLARVGNQLFVGYYGIGVSVVNISNFEQPVETHFIPYADNQYLVLPSSDGHFLLQAGDRNGEFQVTRLK